MTKDEYEDRKSYYEKSIENYRKALKTTEENYANDTKKIKVRVDEVSKELADKIKEKDSIIKEIEEYDPDFSATVIPDSIINERKFSGFYTDPEDHPIVNKIFEAISEIYHKPEKKIWTFATDGRIYANLGLPVIGFGPGEEKFAHTQMDHIRVIDFLDAVKVYAYLACTVCETI